MMNQAHISYIEAHLDAGGQISHENAVSLFQEVQRLRGALEAAKETLHHAAQRFHELDDAAWRDRVTDAANKARADLDTPPASATISATTDALPGISSAAWDAKHELPNKAEA